MSRLWITLAVSAVVTLGGASAHATAEQQCQAARATAAAVYASCELKAVAKYQTGVFSKLASKCRVKYTDTWAKLQAKPGLAGTSCTASRFVDNGDGTVTDNLTGLVWAKQADGGRVYTWSDTGFAADGTVFKDLLPPLNNGPCFAGQCDWRLPTREELQTLLVDPFIGVDVNSGCPTASCINPIFGPTFAGCHWTATPLAGSPGGAWVVNFYYGSVGVYSKIDPYNCSARAVRGGL